MKIRLTIISLLLAYTLGGATSAAQTQSKPRKVSYTVERIWGDGTRHCAFTSLIKYRGKYYCAFRDGYSHIFNADGEADGKIRIISSANGHSWRTVALLSREGYDLRDPKLSITPDGRLMLNLGCSLYRSRKLVSQESLVSFSSNGKNFSELTGVVMHDLPAGSRKWMWRLTWHEGVGYGVTYFGTDNTASSTVALLQTRDGLDYDTLRTFRIPDFPNEATVRFAPDGSMLVFVRRDAGSRSTILLSAPAPYRTFTQRDLGFFMGGPDAIALDDGQIVAGGRSTYAPSACLELYCGDAQSSFRPALILPSGGDCSYPSFLIQGKELWVTYYSMHESRLPNIYLARIPLSVFAK